MLCMGVLDALVHVCGVRIRCVAAFLQPSLACAAAWLWYWMDAALVGPL
jgi:hypothetical protein